MQGETPGPDLQEPQVPVESTDSVTKVVQGLRDRFEDPKELRKFSKNNDVKSKKWGSEVTVVLEAFQDKYENWPGLEEGKRQIKEYLGEGHGSRWQAKTLERYRERFPEGAIDQEKWDETVLLVRDELSHERLEMYKEKAQLRDDKGKVSEISNQQQTVGDRISSILEPKIKNTEVSPNTEKIDSIRANGETRGEDESNRDAILVNTEKNIYGTVDGVGHERGSAEDATRA